MACHVSAVSCEVDCCIWVALELEIDHGVSILGSAGSDWNLSSRVIPPACFVETEMVISKDLLLVTISDTQWHPLTLASLYCTILHRISIPSINSQDGQI